MHIDRYTYIHTCIMCVCIYVCMYVYTRVDPNHYRSIRLTRCCDRGAPSGILPLDCVCWPPISLINQDRNTNTCHRGTAVAPANSSAKYNSYIMSRI